MSRDLPGAVGTADCQPEGGQHTDFLQDHPDDSAWGSERHADADFSRTARHSVGHRAVQAGARDHQSPDRKRAAESRARFRC